MNKISRRSFLTAAAACGASAALTACGGSSASSSGNPAASAASTSTANGAHEPISICIPNRNVKDFIDVVHKTYPEIVFDVDSYAGQNGTCFMVGELLSDNVPDIYSVSIYLSPEDYPIADRLMDLSGYSFTDNYVSSRLREVTEDGAIYLLPSYYNCLGITYNKKILSDNGWTLPKSLEELEELAPKVKEAGYRLALNEIGLPGYGFQYLCNILDTGYFSTVDGRKWQRDFLKGAATLQGSADMMNEMQLIQRWRDIGILNDDDKIGIQEDGAVANEMAEGNTLFLLGTTNNVGERGADVEDFGLMPYLSEDGSQNVYILNVSRYIGLSKKLEEPGNEQKLEDVLHVMEIMSGREGIEALNANYVTTNLSPLKDAPNVEGNFYNDIQEEINSGFTAPFIYTGWENVVVPYGNEMVSFITGDAELDDVVSCIDENQHLLTDTESVSYTTVTETISTEGCAKITGIAFVEASGVDLALVSMNVWDAENGATNGEGVNGKLFPLPVTEQEIVAFLPTGWHDNIQTFSLTGAQVKELAETGYDRKDRGFHYPYLLVKKDDLEITEDTTYTVVVCGSGSSQFDQDAAQDTGILGLTAVEDYLSKFDTLTEEEIDWE